MKNTIKIKSNGHPKDTIISCDGISLGAVQKLDYSISVGGVGILKLESILDDIEIETLQKNTEIKVIRHFDSEVIEGIMKNPESKSTPLSGDGVSKRWAKGKYTLTLSESK